MTDEPEDKRGGSCAIVSALCLVALVVAYPLSAGPVEWAIDKRPSNAGMESILGVDLLPAPMPL